MVLHRYVAYINQEVISLGCLKALCCWLKANWYIMAKPQLWMDIFFFSFCFLIMGYCASYKVLSQSFFLCMFGLNDKAKNILGKT